MGTYKQETRNGRLFVWTETKGWELGEEIVEHYDVPEYFDKLESAKFRIIQIIRNLEREKHLERFNK